MTQKGWKHQLALFWRGWGASIIVAVLIATSFKSAIADWNDIPSGSMTPTILSGDRVFVNKLAYDLKVPYTTWHVTTWSAPQRGDIVVFYSPEDGKRKRLIKRVVGLPGDRIAMKNNRLSINGINLEYEAFHPKESYNTSAEQQPQDLYYIEDLLGKKHTVMFTPFRGSRSSFESIAIPEGKYLMLGDNRDRSADSRFFGLVDRNLIVGRATAVVISRDKSFFHPRFKRFFTGLS